MSYNDEDFPPSYSRTYVDYTYCAMCMGIASKEGGPPDGILVVYDQGPFSKSMGRHRHYVRQIPLVHPKEQGEGE